MLRRNQNKLLSIPSTLFTIKIAEFLTSVVDAALSGNPKVSELSYYNISIGFHVVIFHFPKKGLLEF
jgi:hypothetical protein